MNFEAILSNQLGAPKDNATIEMLCRREEYSLREFPQSLELDPVKGVIGDRWSKYNWVLKDDGTPDERNQLSLLPKRIYEGICVESDAIHPGDTIIADMDMSMKNLPIGTRLSIGKVTLEVSDVPNYGCTKWRDRYGQDAWKFIARKMHQPHRLRGVLCQIIMGGIIQIGQKITKSQDFS